MCAGAIRRTTTIGAIVALGLGLAACATGEVQQTQEGPVTTCEYQVSGDPAKPVDPPSKQASTEGTAQVTMTMAAGTVTMTLDRAKAPCAVHSFESLVAQQYFDDTRCHRLVDRGIFVLQCGDPSGTGRGGPGYTFADELSGKEKYTRGVVAMANAGKDTNGSQFFIVWDDSQLDPDYTVLGTVDEKSLKVVGGIASQGVDGKDGMSPIADASIRTVTVG